MQDNNIKQDPSIDVSNMFNDEVKAQKPVDTSKGIVIAANHKPADIGDAVLSDTKDLITNEVDRVGKALSAGEDPFNSDKVELSNNETYKSMVNRGEHLSPDAQLIRTNEKMCDEYIKTPTGVYPKNHPRAQAYINSLNAVKEKLNSETVDTKTDKSSVDIGEPITSSPVIANQVSVDNKPKEAEIMSFDVPAEAASEFISSMSVEDRDKLERSKTVKVNEVVLKDVPVATRRIRDISEYRRVIPKANVAETIDAVLINSGYVATFKGCGALKLASLLPDSSDTQDWNKRYSLCYEQLVDTSIGKLSYQEFVSKTASSDIDECLRSILRAGCVDEDEVMFNCGSCGSEYNAKFTYSTLIDIDTMPDETKEQMDKIMKARSSFDEAKELQESSPVMTAKIVKLSDDLTVSVKCTDGTTAIAVNTKLKALAEKYNQISAAFVVYINKVWLTQKTDDGKENVYLIDNPDVIADIVYNMSDEELEIIRQAIIGVYEVPKFTYSFKGDFYCPNCGKHENRIKCDRIDDLVFHRVQKLIV